MTTPVTLGQPPDIDYPDSDGQPMSDNTLQFQWIVTLQGNLDALFQNDRNVFVAGDLLWYPVLGHPEIRAAPDALVAFGRPKGYRGSYRQWQEGGIAPQVVFEVLSPGNRPEEMEHKFQFYDTYGVEEYYLYDPDGVVLSGWQRVGPGLQSIAVMHNWVSPRLKVRFDMAGPELVIYDPQGQRFLTFLEVYAQWKAAGEQAERDRKQARQARRQAAKAEQRAKDEQQQRQKAEQRVKDEQQQREKAEQQAKDEQRQREKAEQRAKDEQQQREKAEQRSRWLEEQLRAAGLDPKSLPGSPDE